ncbi:VOC family protein [Ornithinimicrobium cerasi]|uniref:Putative pterin-4-alpha-carbinolamine dehydratase n=1 Tax=Ornithinimicrobium cerasi TaxID=2248773 RepID=A0A285VDM3_9MICO|nr:VOC family protein [Ornithinimicrobium cerasi]SOC52057.1 4a-hydroxytetrahydrobiopterin dehydratase [Ornithinimicrobium cerasi]
MTEDTQDPTQAKLSTDPELGDWRVLLGTLVARWETGGFRAGAEFAGRIAVVADELDHHPDVDLRYPHVTVTTVSHDVGRLTGRDRRLAAAISGIARELGLTPRPGQLSVLEVGLDVMSAPAVADFWRAALGYDTEAGSSVDEPALVDPAGRHAGLWFQQMEQPRTDRNRFHLDVTVPHDVARERVARALEAGGRLVSDEHAPSWWVLADAEGNEACICTWQGRGGGEAQDG